MRKILLIPALLLSVLDVPGAAQSIVVSVRDPGDKPVQSNVYFRRSSSSGWDRLGETDSNGVVRAPLSCAPGVEIYADPVPGEYYNSPEMACQPALPLRVASRQRRLLTALLSEAGEGGKVGATREDLAYELARAEAEEWRGHAKGGDTALHAYLASSKTLTAERASLIRINLLNESSGFYSQVDADKDGLLTRKEINLALSKGSVGSR